jgi:hypothetical protein
VSKVYIMEGDSGTKPLERVACVNEDKELQLLLERNLNLLPGDQLDPGNSLRWLLVKREMPVVSPSSGEALWSIDFLLVDQDSVPTLVECKRRNDARRPRETVGQMLEYAANGRHYWTASELQIHALNAAGDASKLDQQLRDLTGSEVDTEGFFALVEANLRKSKMRLIFVLDDSSNELRSIVEFLNGQMKDTEVLIVEARQYQHENARIVVPWVFGFTEEARVAKRESKAETGRTSVARGEANFWDSIEATPLSADGKRTLRRFVESAEKIPGCEVSWQRGPVISLPGVVPQKALAGIWRDGTLEVYLARWQPPEGISLTEGQQKTRDEFFGKLQTIFKMNPDDLKKQYPQLSTHRWLPKAGELEDLIRHLARAEQFANPPL